MRLSSIFSGLFVVAGALLAVVGCGGGGSGYLAPGAAGSNPSPTPTAAARYLYAVRAGQVSVYTLPLKANEKPLHVIDETPGQPTQSLSIAVDIFGHVAIASTTDVRLFNPPITSFAPSKAKLTIPLTQAITPIGSTGADLVDLEFDPNLDLWFFSATGDITELQAPLTRQSVARADIVFGAPGSKTAGYSSIVQGRFDISNTLYVLANNPNTGALLFKIGYPYGKPPSGFYGLNLSQAAFVDGSEWTYGPPPGAGTGVVLGQYFGALKGVPPLKPTPPPVNVLAQFTEPIIPQLTGVFPTASVKAIVGALAADPPRNLFYTIDAADGRLNAYSIPLTNNAKPKITLACTSGPSICNGKLEHLFLAP